MCEITHDDTQRPPNTADVDTHHFRWPRSILHFLVRCTVFFLCTFICSFGSQFVVVLCSIFFARFLILFDQQTLSIQCHDVLMLPSTCILLLTFFQLLHSQPKKTTSDWLAVQYCHRVHVYVRKCILHFHSIIRSALLAFSEWEKSTIGTRWWWWWCKYYPKPMLKMRKCNAFVRVSISHIAYKFQAGISLLLYSMIVYSAGVSGNCCK